MKKGYLIKIWHYVRLEDWKKKKKKISKFVDARSDNWNEKEGNLKLGMEKKINL